MKIERLHADDCGRSALPGGGAEIIRKRSPTWDDVEYAVRRLDGDRFTEVCLSDSQDTGMIIAGGCGRYLCERMQLEHNYLLLDPSKDEEPTLAITYDGDEYPGNWNVDIDMALKAAQTFFETGQLDPSLQWWGR